MQVVSALTPNTTSGLNALLNAVADKTIAEQKLAADQAKAVPLENAYNQAKALADQAYAAAQLVWNDIVTDQIDLNEKNRLVVVRIQELANTVNPGSVPLPIT